MIPLALPLADAAFPVYAAVLIVPALELMAAAALCVKVIGGVPLDELVAMGMLDPPLVMLNCDDWARIALLFCDVDMRLIWNP